jgi:peptidoglycan hydrolase-like protein with peptidoglycan-binding domain
MNRTIARIPLLPATTTLSAGALLGASPVFAADHTSPTVLQATTAPYLHVGSSGDAVRVWQQDVNLLSSRVTGIPSIAIDGVYGPQTESSNWDMQRYSKVAADGVVGPRTRAALDRAIHRVPAGASTNRATAARVRPSELGILTSTGSPPLRPA